MNKEEIRQMIREELANLILTDRYAFDKNIQILDKYNIQLGRTTGTKIGTATDQKLGLWGATPVVQQAKIADPTGGGDAGVDSSARTAIVAIIDVLEAIGATSKT